MYKAAYFVILSVKGFGCCYICSMLRMYNKMPNINKLKKAKPVSLPLGNMAGLGARGQFGHFQRP